MLVAVGVAALDPKAGFRSWWQLRADLAAAEGRIGELREQVAARRDEATGLEGDDFRIERAIRQDLGWARPGEIVLRLPEEAPSLRNP